MSERPQRVILAKQKQKAMTIHQLLDTSVKGSILLLVLSVNAFVVSAQSFTGMPGDLIREKAKAISDSVRELTSKKCPVYMGAELAFSYPQYLLKSRIAELKQLPVSFIGMNLGGIIGNQIGKVKTNVGMYRSNPAVPYEIDMIQGAVSANIYFLRLKKITYHTLEPYSVVGITYQRTKFYGNYLPTANDGGRTQINYSSSEPPVLGRTGFAAISFGAGVEYQLESKNELFIHFFAEVGYGIKIGAIASNSSFDGTAPSNLTSISIGTSFGIMK